MAEDFGQKVVEWDPRVDTIPAWLDDAAAHPILLVDLRRRLALRQDAAEVPSITARMEEGAAGQPRWRVLIDWADESSISLLLAFEDLDSTPHLVSVGGDQDQFNGGLP